MPTTTLSTAASRRPRRGGEEAAAGNARGGELRRPRSSRSAYPSSFVTAADEPHSLVAAADEARASEPHASRSVGEAEDVDAAGDIAQSATQGGKTPDAAGATPPHTQEGADAESAATAECAGPNGADEPTSITSQERHLR